MRNSQWWLCPNDPPCNHGRIFHDSDDNPDDPDANPPTCCFEGCACGHVMTAEEAQRILDEDS